MRVITHGGAGHPQEGQVISDETLPDIVYPPKRTSMSWDEFRKLFTDDELEGLDSYDDGTIPLNAAQKRKIKTFLEKGKARGSDRIIDVTTAGMASAIDYLVARGFVSATNDTRKNEIIAGIVKS